MALAGWSSNSKYPLLGGLRSSAQMVSYELALDHVRRGRHPDGRNIQSERNRDLAAGFPLGIRAAMEPDRLADAAGAWFFLVFHRGRRGNQSRAVRSGRSRIRTGRRISHRVCQLQVRDVFHGGILQHDHGVLPGDDFVFWRMALAVSADCVVGMDALHSHGGLRRWPASR